MGQTMFYLPISEALDTANTGDLTDLGGCSGVTRLAVVSDPRFGFAAGPGHPERPARLAALAQGVTAAGLDDALIYVPAREATLDELKSVHSTELLEALEALSKAGGGQIDADTLLRADTLVAARLAAGSGLGLIEVLDSGQADIGFCAVRPPGHHATPVRSMGFCIFNNLAIAARSLASAGERVLIVDFDAHHGNGTQAVFWDDPDVVFVSLHEWPLYPGTGALDDVGGPNALGSTVNVPLPAGTTGDVYRRAVDDLIAPIASHHGATWLLISAGFDAHRADPLTNMGLSAGDFADLTAALVGLVPPGRCLMFLEGGYDLQALTDSVGATFAALLETHFRPELPTDGGPGLEALRAATTVNLRTRG